ncbi:MAG TPA: hypothetical protein DCY27_08850 [Desulfobacterales bacterium]|nr:hypothetical protein [Desulfobacterales bacterium]
MKTRFTPILLILAIIVAAILSRFIGGSDYILAQTSNLTPYKTEYKFFYCPFNRLPYTSPTFPYKGYPSIRIPYPTDAPWLKLYPCPCTNPAVNSLLLEDEYQQ